MANKFLNAQIGVSSITTRHDIQVLRKIGDVNDKIREMRKKHNNAYIHHNKINETCLNGCRLHLNAKGQPYWLTCVWIHTHIFYATQFNYAEK